MKRTVLIAVPALNEETVLAGSVNRIRAFADESLAAYDVTVLIADNGSTDATERIGRELAASMPGVDYVRANERGKGNAVRAAWGTRAADAFVFMDADLATDLAALPELLRRIDDGAGLAVGSRFLEGAAVRRSFFRRLLSSGYRRFLHAVLGVKTGDAPCGFKAASAAVVREVLPLVENKAWFFDSELIVRAERMGFRVDEVPVTWRETHPSGRRSKVRVLSLISEYVREVIRLRRELGGAPVQPEERTERGIVMAMAALLIILTSVVPAYGWIAGSSSGLEWSGRTSFAPGDLAIYLSSIAQASQGSFFLQNLASTESFVGVPNPVWYAVGLFSRVTDAAPLLAFHLIRIALILAATFVFWRAMRFFVSDRHARVTALALLFFGSGVGMYAMYVLTPSVPRVGAYEWPTDLWVAESNVFASFGYSPHFVASWLFQILALFLIARAFSRRKLRDAVCGGLAGFTLLSFHPFYAPTICTVALAWFGLWVWRRGLVLRDVTLLATFLGLSLLPVAYYAYIIFGTVNGRFMHEANLLWTPSLPIVLIGLGGFALLAPFGFVGSGDSDPESRWRGEELALWALVNAALIYAPITFQRRLMEGLQFPLAALAGMAIFAACTSLRKTNVFVTACAGVLILALFIPSTFFVVMRDVKMIAERDAFAFFVADESAALRWLRASTPTDATVLSSFTVGNDVIGWGERRAYAGHWSQTVDVGQKMADVAWFFGGATSAHRMGFMNAHGVDFVLEGPIEHSYGGSLAHDRYFEAVFSQGEYAVYAKRP